MFTILFGIFNFTLGQFRPDSVQLTALSNLQKKMNNTLGVHWNDKTGTPDIITFNKPYSYASDELNSAKLFLKDIENILQKKNVNDDFVLQGINTDSSLQYIHFTQTYKKIPVLGGNYVVTVLPGGKVQSVLGSFYKDISLDITPNLPANRAFNSAKQNPPKSLSLQDYLISSRLVIYPKDSLYVLAWELELHTSQEGENWIYLIDALTGNVLSSRSTAVNELSTLFLPAHDANVYLHHPYIDGSYTYISPINDNSSGYLQGTYANVINDANSRAYSSIFDFAYSPGNTHFDEANLFYHIDNFRRNYWNLIGFNAFTQITAHAHTYFAGGPNAMYSSNQLWFSDGQGVTGFNSFAREDKVIMHEYTHAVTDYIAHLYNTAYNGYNETYAIHEGNSDYFAASYTGRTLINEYCCYGYQLYQRDISNPRIATYSQYQSYSGYPYVEPHDGGELWSLCLWNLRESSIGQYYADRVTYRGLNGIPSNSSFLQYRQAIIDADINYYSGTHTSTIRHVFYLRGIGPDYLHLSINGPSYLRFKQTGTYTANIIGGSGSVSRTWYDSPNGNNWHQLGTSASVNYTMLYFQDVYIRLDVHDNVTGENASNTITVHYDNGLPKAIASNDRKILPSKFSIDQNYPNPFNPTTQITYALPKSAMVNIKVYDLLGREVRELVNEQKEAGFYTVNFNASLLSSGIYLYRITALQGEEILYSESKRMILIK